jgi:hypothetical protein
LDTGTTGTVLVPNLLGGLMAKAAATGIAVRVAEDRDWQDAAFLLTFPIDPGDITDDVLRSDRKLLFRLRPMLNQGFTSLATLRPTATAASASTSSRRCCPQSRGRRS